MTLWGWREGGSLSAAPKLHLAINLTVGIRAQSCYGDAGLGAMHLLTHHNCAICTLTLGDTRFAVLALIYSYIKLCMSSKKHTY